MVLAAAHGVVRDAASAGVGRRRSARLGMHRLRRRAFDCERGYGRWRFCGVRTLRCERRAVGAPIHSLYNPDASAELMLTPVGSGTTVRSVNVWPTPACGDATIPRGSRSTTASPCSSSDSCSVPITRSFRRKDATKAPRAPAPFRSTARRWASCWIARPCNGRRSTAAATKAPKRSFPCSRRTHHHARFARSRDGGISSPRASLLPDLIERWDSRCDRLSFFCRMAA